MMQTSHIPPDISSWKRQVQMNAANQERTRQAMLQAVDSALQRLSEEYAWEEVFIFGSVTKPGGFSEVSDIDIGIRGLPKLLLYEFVGKISMLLDREVDVVRLEECRFAAAIMHGGIRWTRRVS